MLRFLLTNHSYFGLAQDAAVMPQQNGVRRKTVFLSGTGKNTCRRVPRNVVKMFFVDVYSNSPK